jgi:hypothetical protein
MLRLLLLFVLIFYALYKLGLFRVFAGSVKQGYDEPDTIRRKPPGSNVHIDRAPPKEKSKPVVKGGEYIDYEEVKDS